MSRWRNEGDDMLTVLVINSKGGSGKTTLTTNFASYYANKKSKTEVACGRMEPVKLLASPIIRISERHKHRQCITKIETSTKF